MRAVVQRCLTGSVSVENRTIAQIGAGFVVFIGVGTDDTDDDAIYLADKIAKLRVMSDDAGKMNKSVLDTGGEVLAISQFTLYGDTRGGRRPSFIGAARPEEGLRLFNRFAKALSEHGVKVQTGEFGADMLVRIENDGPVTILIDSSKNF